MMTITVSKERGQSIQSGHISVLTLEQPTIENIQFLGGKLRTPLAHGFWKSIAKYFPSRVA